MTMRPGPRIAMRVMRRCFQVSRGATSPCRMVPNAPWMWPTWASSRAAPRASLGLTRMVTVCLLAGPAQEAKPKFGYLPRETERLDWVGVSGSLGAPDETLEANSGGPPSTTLAD